MCFLRWNILAENIQKGKNCLSKDAKVSFQCPIFKDFKTRILCIYTNVIKFVSKKSIFENNRVHYKSENKIFRRKDE